MATRLNYAAAIARQFMVSAGRRLRPGGLAAGLAARPETDPLVIVAGAGRSGTSAVARVLHESGVRMGDELGAPADANPDGYYEDMGVWWLHERLFQELGMSGMWRPGRWPWRSTVLAVAARYRAEMEELVAKAAGGWKDPRFAITLEAWLPLLPAPPKLVVCLRSPASYADSTIRIYGFVDRDVAERQWANHYRRLLAVIRDYKLEATCVEYDALVERPKETTAALAEFVGRPLSPEYVSPPHRHFTRPVPQRYAELYRDVHALAGSGPPLAPVATQGQDGTLERDEVASPLTDEDVQTIESYLGQVNDIDARTNAEKAAWTSTVGFPRPKLLRPQEQGMTPPEALQQAREASAAYASAVACAQETLGTLQPPRGFRRYHELTERQLNLERMLSELMLAAAGGETLDRQTLDGVMRAWHRFGRSEPFEKAQEIRERELVKALEASGYAAARRAPAAG